MTIPTPVTALHLALAVPETAENFTILRELIHALKDLVTLADTKESRP